MLRQEIGDGTLARRGFWEIVSDKKKRDSEKDERQTKKTNIKHQGHTEEKLRKKWAGTEER